MNNVRALVALVLLATPAIASTITAKAALPIPTILRRQTGIGACAGFTNVESSCALATPNFSSLEFSDQASCLCYQSSTFAPNVFDAYWVSCLSYYSSASPSFYSTNLNGSNVPTAPCLIAGNPASTSVVTSAISSASSAISSKLSSASASASISSKLSSSVSGVVATGASTATVDPNVAACSKWESIGNSCAAATTGFADLSFSQAASCLCYTSRTVYAPLVYDGQWRSCLRFIQTANATLYSEVVAQGFDDPTPCQELGNILATTSASTSSSSSTRSSTTTSTRPTSTTASTTSASASASASSSDATAYKSTTLRWILSIVGAATMILVL